MCNYTLFGQLEKVIVEKYYISDSSDTLDSFGSFLPEGAVTYRIFADLEEGFALKSLHGDTNHPFIINSSDNFFNHQGFGSYYGYSIKDPFFKLGNMPLDSWLTLGYSSNNYMGIPKDIDPDTSIVGGENNMDNMLKNDNEDAGIPVFKKDGNVLSDSSYTTFKLSSSIADTVFGSKVNGNLFYYNNDNKETKGDILVSNLDYGMVGPTTDNIILIGQLTTKGNLSFEMNLEIVKIDSIEDFHYFYYAHDTLINSKQRKYYSKWLSYPFLSGCTDPWFAQYNPEAIVDDGSCKDSIEVGCTDPLACNYDPNANYNVSEICCYGPDNCDDRDIEVVCPDYQSNASIQINIYPNPSKEKLTVEVLSAPVNTGGYIRIYNSYGTIIVSEQTEGFYERMDRELTTEALNRGVYLLQVVTLEGAVAYKTFVKE
jgi:hypothetical protein